MSRRRLLLLLKPFNENKFTHKEDLSRITNPKILGYIENRQKVHKDAINTCLDILRRKSIDWKALSRSDLSHPIRDVEMVISIGGDGTLLHASHFVDDSIPLLGVNSDPTQAGEVEEFRDEFDARRSTGYLCAATVKNFEQVLDDILEGCKAPTELSRISVSINNQWLPHFALNDILIADSCPAAVSSFSFRIVRDDKLGSPMVNCQSSGLRVCTAAGSTAAMLSAGGFSMPILSRDLQYMVREPISSRAADSRLMHGLIKSDHSIQATWYSHEGRIYIDGCHIFHSIHYGDALEISSKAPCLKVFLPSHLISSNSMLQSPRLGLL